MVLHLIGIGLTEPSNITTKGLNAIQSCKIIYLYASAYQPYDKIALEKYLDRNLEVIENTKVISKIHELAVESCNDDIALLLPGDPFCDNLYPKLKLECAKIYSKIEVVHNSGLLNEISNSGLQLYRFGETLYGNNVEQTSCLLSLAKENVKRDLHSLIILDPDSDIFQSLTRELMSAGISEVQGSLIKKGSTDSASYGVVLVTAVSSALQIHGPLAFDADFTSFDPATVRALIITATLHEMEETVLSYNSAPNSYHVEGKGTFHLIGLGLGQPEDITIKGKLAIEDSQYVYLEGYTSIMLGGKEKLEKYFGKEIVVADRELVESNSDEILTGLELGNVAFLVVGDPLGATTHTDLIMRAAKAASSVNIIHNASIINAAAVSGLKPDKFGEVVSIPFWEDSWKPDSFYDKICCNAKKGLHTLCLLDIKVKEQSLENIMKQRKIYEKPRFMAVAQAADILLQIIKARATGEGESSFVSDEMGDQCARILEGRADDLRETTSEQVDAACDQLNKIVKHKLDKELLVDQTIHINANSEVICLARIGTEDERILMTSLNDTAHLEFGNPLHSLIIIGSTDIEEKMFLKLHKIKP